MEIGNMPAKQCCMRRDAAIVALGALAQEIRLELVSLLARSGAEGLPAGVIAEQLGVPPASLSFHFQQLVRGGLLTQRRRSRNVIYAANIHAMAALLSYLHARWQTNAEAPEELGAKVATTPPSSSLG